MARTGPSRIRELLGGAGMLWRGLRLWGSRPGAMLLGAVPGLVVGAVYVAGIVVLALNIEQLVDAITPFAADWDDVWRRFIRIFVGAALLVGAGALAFVSFTAVALVVGDPVYERIWRASEESEGGFEERPVTFWRSAGDSILLVLRSIGAGLLAALLGFVPVVGQVLAPVAGVLLAGAVLSRELLVRPLEARGVHAAGRSALLRGHRARALGLGIMTQLCFLIPGGALLVMPAAVVAATDLARRMTPLAPVAPPGPPAPPASAPPRTLPPPSRPSSPRS